MNKIYILFLVGLLCCGKTFAQTWTGTTSTDWNVATNWSSGVVPGPLSNVIVTGTPSGGNFPRFSTNVIIRTINLSPGSQIDFNGRSLELQSLSGFNYFDGTTVNNTGTGDIAIIINTGTGGFESYISNGSVFNDNLMVTATGVNSISEGSSGAANIFNGNVSIVINSALTLNMSNTSSSNYNGNLTITRTVAGTLNLFDVGASITGNLNISCTNGAALDLGNAATTTNIIGAIDINCVDATPLNFTMQRIKNLVATGSISVQGSAAPNLRNDTLRASSIAIQNYRGAVFAEIYNNDFTGLTIFGDAASYGGGYSTSLRSNIFRSNCTFNLNGSNNFLEADAANSTNKYLGNLTCNIASTASVFLSTGDSIDVAGNLVVNRTGNGATSMFGDGGTIAGNCSFSNNSSGTLSIGDASKLTTINGQINISNIDTSIATFTMLKIKNLTDGGSVIAENTSGFNVADDTLLVTNFRIKGYRGNTFAMLYRSKITGNVSIEDDASYAGGYSTTLRNNDITGNTSIIINGVNELAEADGANFGNKFTGNLTVLANNTATLNISAADTIAVTGSISISRTAAGITNAFHLGGNISGNFSFLNNTSGNLIIGSSTSTTTINGTINVTNVNATPSTFQLLRLKNLTAGGTITAQNTRGFLMNADTVIVTSVNVSGYRGGDYGYLFSNKITGNLTLQDDASYAGGYTTTLRSNEVIGNSIFTVNGINPLIDADGPNFGNKYTGNVSYTATGSGALTLAVSDTVNVSGNMSVSRTGSGTSSMFGAGGTIGGNFSFVNNVDGAMIIGNLTSTTNIAGTVNVSMSGASPNIAEISRIKNNSTGGTINLTGTRGFRLRNDTLMLSAVQITGYRGGEFGYLLRNSIIGNVSIADDASYTGGFTTDVENNKIEGSTSFTLNGLNLFNEAISANTGNIYLGDVQYNRVGSGAMNIATGDTSSYGKSLILNSSIARPINITRAKFISNQAGTFNQLGTQAFTIPTIIMAKAPRSKLTLGKTFTTATTLILDSGIIKTSAANKLVMPDNFVYTGGSDKSFIEGPMDKIGNDAFIFPVGVDSVLAAIAISAPAVVTDVFTAQYFETNPGVIYDSTAKAITLDHISRSEYWTLDRTTGTSNVTVRLYYDTLRHSGRIIDRTELRVARWNGTSWLNEGNGGTTGTDVAGTIVTAAPISSFSPFTLASTTARNTLPVQLISFTGVQQNGLVQLKWNTENETNVSHYEIERSKDGNNYAEISREQSLNQLARTQYQENDFLAEQGVYYYRLKIVDRDGSFKYSAVVKLTVDVRITISVFPNPVADHLTVTGLPKNAMIKIIDASGKVLVAHQVNEQVQKTIPVAQLSAGIYNLQVISKGEVYSTRFVKY